MIVGAITVILDIFLDDLGGDFVPDRARKVAIFPELAAPQLTLDLGKLAKDGAGTVTFEQRHDLRD